MTLVTSYFAESHKYKSTIMNICFEINLFYWQPDKNTDNWKNAEYRIR